MYDCEHLPAFAQFLLTNHLEDYARTQVDLCTKLNVPIMASLASRFSKEQIVKLSIESSREYLTFIAGNNAFEQVTLSMEKWLKDKLDIVSKAQITAEDITLINHMRGKALKKFIPAYSKEIDIFLCISNEIDTILLGAITTATDIYIDILKNKINEQSNLAAKLIEASPAITFLFDIGDKKNIFISGNVKEVMGYTPDELLDLGGNILFELTHPQDIALLVEHIEMVIAKNNNETHHLEYRFRHKDGTYRWIRTYEVIFKRDSYGKPIQILGKTFEITREKETQLALHRSEKQLLEAQSIAHIGSYEWNLLENRSSNTAEVFRIFELDQDQKYEEFITRVHPDDVQKVKDAVAESFITGNYECAYRYEKNGNEKVIWSVGKVEFRNNAPYRMIGTVQDVTEIKRMEKELIQKSAELANSNESLRQFAYVASHDMKEPLRKIMMFSDMVINAERERLSEKSINQLRKMQASSKNLFRMIEDILSFSLLEAKEEKQKVKLSTIIHQVTDILEETIKEKNASIIFNGLPEVTVITSQFRQLFQNLIANSLKFARKDEPPKIVIRANITSSPSLELDAPTKQFLEINVEDNGIGFPEEANEQVFELFNRFHPKTQYEGTGLGLSISRRIVQNHHGVIRASGKQGRGAIFTIVIPHDQLN